MIEALPKADPRDVKVFQISENCKWCPNVELLLQLLKVFLLYSVACICAKHGLQLVSVK